MNRIVAGKSWVSALIRRLNKTIAVKAQENRNYRVWPDQARGTINFSIELQAESDSLMPTVSSTGQTLVKPVLRIWYCRAQSHHKLVHEGGYSVQRDHAGELFSRQPNGKAIPHCGYRLDDQVEADSITGRPEVDRFGWWVCEKLAGVSWCSRVYGSVQYRGISGRLI